MNHQASPTQTVGERRLFKYTMYLTFQCTCLFPSWFKSGEGVKFERTRTEKLATTPQLSHLGTYQIVLDAIIPTTVIMKRNEKGKTSAVWKEERGWEGLTPVDSSSASSSSSSACPSSTGWGGPWRRPTAVAAHTTGAPCVASLPPLMNSTSVVVGLWELPGLSLLRHYNMLNSPQRLPDWHQCIVWTVQRGPHASKNAHLGSPRNLLPKLFALEMLINAALHCNETVKLQLQFVISHDLPKYIFF